MKSIECYTGNLAENIKDVPPTLLALRTTRQDDILLYWNGVFLWIERDSTYEGLLDEYHNKIDTI